MRILLALVAVVALQGGPALIPYGEAKPILAAHGKAVAESEWPAWAANRDTEIRARLARGSGIASIDQEVQTMVRRASPFPAPPSGRAQSFTVPVRFRLN